MRFLGTGHATHFGVHHVKLTVFHEGAHRRGSGSFHKKSSFGAETMIPKTVTQPVGRGIKSEHRAVLTYSYFTLLLWHFESYSAASWPLSLLRMLRQWILPLDSRKQSCTPLDL